MTQEMSCRICGCTDDNCTDCYLKTGEACHWQAPGLCSACAQEGTTQGYSLNPTGLFVPADGG